MIFVLEMENMVVEIEILHMFIKYITFINFVKLFSVHCGCFWLQVEYMGMFSSMLVPCIC